MASRRRRPRTAPAPASPRTSRTTGRDCSSPAWRARSGSESQTALSRQTRHAGERLEVIPADAPAPDERDAKGRWGRHPASPTGAIPSPRRTYGVPHPLQVPSPVSSRRTPHAHTHPMRRAGTPATSAYGSTSLVTTAPAPTNAYSPSVTPHTMVALAPIDGAAAHEGSLVLVLPRHVASGVDDVREHHGRSAEHVVLELDAFVDRDVVLYFHVVAQSRAAHDDDVLAEVAAFTDHRARHHVAEMPDLRVARRPSRPRRRRPTRGSSRLAR